MHGGDTRRADERPDRKSVRPGRRPITAGLSAIAIAGAAGLSGWAPASPAAAATPSFTWQNSGLSGGGFISAIGRSGNTLVAGGDTQGLFSSTNGGATWEPRNDNMSQTWQRKVAAILPPRAGATNPMWYAAVGDGEAIKLANGDKREKSGVYRSTNGVDWQLITVDPNNHPFFNGSNPETCGVTINGHPRATGNLLAYQGSTKLYAAGMNGLFRGDISSDGDVTLTQVAISSGGGTVTPFKGQQLRSLQIKGNYAYVVRQDCSTSPSRGRVARVNLSDGTITHLAIDGHQGSKKPGVQEIAIIGPDSGVLYAAAHDGIWRCTGCTTNGTPNWARVGDHNANLKKLLGDADFYSLTASRASGSNQGVIYATTYASSESASAGRFKNVVEITETFASGTSNTWSSTAVDWLTDDEAVEYGVYGSNTDWWYADTHEEGAIAGCSNCSANNTAKNNYVGSSIAVSGDALFVAGRAGVWRMELTNSPVWRPAVNGLSTTFTLNAAAHPTNVDEVAFTDADWHILGSYDKAQSIIRLTDEPLPHATNLDTTGLSVAWDRRSSPGLIYSGGLQNLAGTDHFGTVYFSEENPIRRNSPPPTWPVETSLTNRPRPIAVTATNSGSQYKAIVAFENVGLRTYRDQGGVGSWVEPTVANSTTAKPTFTSGSRTAARFATSTSGHVVYLFDAQTRRLWRTNAAGNFKTWTYLGLIGNAAVSEGWLAVHPTKPDQVWVTTPNAVFHVASADDCTRADTVPDSNPDPDPTTDDDCVIKTVSLQVKKEDGTTVSLAGGGPLAFDKGSNLYVALGSRAVSSKDPTVSQKATLFRARPGASPGSTLDGDDIATNYYRRVAAFPSTIAVSATAAATPPTETKPTVYVGLNGNGLIVSR